MAFRPSKELKLMFNPYVFILKEGREITDDYLDYSLMMLQVTCPETLRSPTKSEITAKKPFTPTSAVESVKSAFNLYSSI